MITLALAIAAAPPAWAATQGAAEADLIKQGVEKRRHNDDEAALALFRQAYALGHSPRAAAQMGLAEIALGRWVDAVAHLEEATSATGDTWIQKNAKTLQQSLERARQEVGTLEVLGAPANAQLIIGGEVRGTLPLPRPVTVRAGELRFEIRAPGYQTEGRTIRVAPGQLTRETVALNAVAPVTEAPRASEPVSPLQVAAAADEAARPSRAGAGLRNAGLIVGGAGAIAGAVGLVFGLRARAAGQTDSAAATFNRSADSTGHTYETLQWIGYGTGAALVVGGAVLYWIGAKRGREPQATSTSISVVPLLEGGGLALVKGSL